MDVGITAQDCAKPFVTGRHWMHCYINNHYFHGPADVSWILLEEDVEEEEDGFNFSSSSSPPHKSPPSAISSLFHPLISARSSKTHLYHLGNIGLTVHATSPCDHVAVVPSIGKRGNYQGRHHFGFFTVWGLQCNMWEIDFIHWIAPLI